MKPAGNVKRAKASAAIPAIIQRSVIVLLPFDTVLQGALAHGGGVPEPKTRIDRKRPTLNVALREWETGTPTHLTAADHSYSVAHGWALVHDIHAVPKRLHPDRRET